MRNFTATTHGRHSMGIIIGRNSQFQGSFYEFMEDIAQFALPDRPWRQWKEVSNLMIINKEWIMLDDKESRRVFDSVAQGDGPSYLIYPWDRIISSTVKTLFKIIECFLLQLPAAKPDSWDIALLCFISLLLFILVFPNPFHRLKECYCLGGHLFEGGY